MIAMLLMAQLGAAQLDRDFSRAPADSAAAVADGPAQPAELLPAFPGLRARVVTSGRCPAAGRMEASTLEPLALYRKGDRPAKGLKNWADYPDAKACLLGGAP